MVSKQESIEEEEEEEEGRAKQMYGSLEFGMEFECGIVRFCPKNYLGMDCKGFLWTLTWFPILGFCFEYTLTLDLREVGLKIPS